MATLHVYHDHAEWIAEALRGRGHDIIALSDPAAFIEALPTIELLVTQGAPRGVFAGAARLRLIHGLGAGVDDLLPAPELPERVVICGARGVFAAEASEHALAMMLALERGLPAMLDRQRTHEWRMFGVGKLEGRTVGVVGVGAIGERILRLATAFGMNVLAHAKRARAGHIALEELLARADHVVVCTPRTPETLDLIDARRLKRGAYLISLGRGGVVNEASLLAALQDGHVGGAALDVFEDEPLSPESPWWTAPNTIVTPHIAGYGRHYLERVAAVVLSNVARFERSEPLLHRIDRTLGY